MLLPFIRTPTIEILSDRNELLIDGKLSLTGALSGTFVAHPRIDDGSITLWVLQNSYDLLLRNAAVNSIKLRRPSPKILF